MTLRTLTTLLRRWLWLPLTTAVLCGLFLFSFMQARGLLPRYSATAVVAIGGDIFFGSQDSAYADLADSMIANYRHLAEREIITAAVADALDLDETPQEVADLLTLSVIDETNLLAIDAHHADPRTAAAIANEVARQLAVYSPSRSRNFVMPVENARPATTPDVGSFIPVVMAAFVGLLLATGGVLLLDFVRQPITDEQDVQQWLQLPTLLTLRPLPLAAWRYWRKRPLLRSETAVWYTLQTVCRRLWQAKAETGTAPRVVLITAPRRSLSHALVSGRLAQSWAAAGRPVLLVDLDGQETAVARSLLGRAPDKGVADLATLPATDRMRLATAVAPGLHLLGPGGWLPDAPLAQRQDAVEALLQLAADDGTLIVHAPPVDESVETAMLARRADLVLLVLEAAHTPAAVARETVTHLAQNDATIDGVVLSHWRTHGLLAWLDGKRPWAALAASAPAPETAVPERRAA